MRGIEAAFTTTETETRPNTHAEQHERVQTIEIPTELPDTEPQASVRPTGTDMVFASSSRDPRPSSSTESSGQSISTLPARAAGAVLDLAMTPVHGAIRVSMTIIAETKKATSAYVGGVVTTIAQWQTPWGRLAALACTPIIAGAFVLGVAQGVVMGTVKGVGGLLKDKYHSFWGHLSGNGPTYFELAGEYYKS